MGNSLHNKIHLGRTGVLSSWRMQAGLAAALLVSIGLAWLALRG